MNNYKFKQPDFENPSFLFVLEDKLKDIFAGKMFYESYYKSFGLIGNETVLDFGCGGGTGAKFLLALLKKGGRLTCLDTSTYWLKKAKARLASYPNVEFTLGEISNVEIPNSTFDIITTVHVIHDIPPEKRQSTIIQLTQKLKKTGYLFIREPIKKSHGMAISEIHSLFKTAGLKEIKRTTTTSEYRGKYQFKP